MTSHDENAHILIDAWKLMAGRLPAARIEQAKGIASMFAQVPLPFLNLSAQDRPSPDLEDVRGLLGVHQARSASCAHGTMLCLLEPWLPAGWQGVATAEGLAPMMEMTGMVLPGEIRPPTRPFPPMEIRRVEHESTARDLAMLNAQAYGMPPELFDCIANLDLWHDDSFAYVGYVDGRAVSTASALPVGGTVYIALVATLPDSHGKGYADAVMRHAIAEGRRGMGFTRTTLHATEMGRPVYQAMGFEAGGKWSLLMPAGH